MFGDITSLLQFIWEYKFHILLLFLLVYGYYRIKRLFTRYNMKREYSKCESPIEEQLFMALTNAGYQVYTQIPCGKYRIDLAIYDGFKKIAIECDGKDFHTSKDQVKHDNTKDRFLKKNRWKVYRFTGSEIYSKRDLCVMTIQKVARPRKK